METIKSIKSQSALYGQYNRIDTVIEYASIRYNELNLKYIEVESLPFSKFIFKKWLQRLKADKQIWAFVFKQMLTDKQLLKKKLKIK